MLEVVALVAAAAIVALMIAAWLLSLARRDASVVDIFWGFGFVLVAGAAFIVGDGYEGRKLLITLMATAWGLRLTAYLLWRNWGKDEDYRYRRMRQRYGARFPVISLFTVFGLQGALMFVVSLPLQAAQTNGPDGFTVFDWLGLAVWAVGLTFESIGDLQLARFKADSANEGKVMDRGLWRYTRHPNYFGDFLVWWGIFLVAASRPEHLWVIVSPLLMSWLLVRVSGVALLERSLKRRRPGYEEYIARTSAFVPMPPKSRNVGGPPL